METNTRELPIRSQPRTDLPHVVAQGAIHGTLWSRFDDGRRGVGAWVVLGQPELRGGELVPDVAAWRRERLPTVPVQQSAELAPDWICEVLSPYTARSIRVEKLKAYAALGVEYAWLVTPRERMLEVLRLRDGLWTIVGGWVDSAVVRVEPFEAIELLLARWWPDSPPQPTPECRR